LFLDVELLQGIQVHHGTNRKSNGAWQERDYATIIAVARKIPKKILQEDTKLLMWYDQAVTRHGDAEMANIRHFWELQFSRMQWVRRCRYLS